MARKVMSQFKTLPTDDIDCAIDLKQAMIGVVTFLPS